MRCAVRAGATNADTCTTMATTSNARTLKSCILLNLDNSLCTQITAIETALYFLEDDDDMMMGAGRVCALQLLLLFVLLRSSTFPSLFFPAVEPKIGVKKTKWGKRSDCAGALSGCVCGGFDPGCVLQFVPTKMKLYRCAIYCVLYL